MLKVTENEFAHVFSTEQKLIKCHSPSAFSVVHVVLEANTGNNSEEVQTRNVPLDDSHYVVE